MEALSKISELPTLLSQHLWVKNGDSVVQTVDYLSSIGIVALTGDSSTTDRDYQWIRERERELRFEEVHPPTSKKSSA